MTDYKATFLLKLTHAQKIEIIIIHVLIYRKFYSNSFPSTWHKNRDHTTVTISGIAYIKGEILT